MVVTLRTPWRPEGQQERVSSASTDTGVPIVLSADHPGFERPTARTKGEWPNHWTVLAYLLWKIIFYVIDTYYDV